LKKATGAMLAIFEVDAYRLDCNAREPCWFLPTPPQPGALDLLLKEGTMGQSGGITLETLRILCHTEGGYCFYCEGGGLFFGNTLFEGSSDRTDTLGASPAKMKASLQRLAQLRSRSRAPRAMIARRRSARRPGSQTPRIRSSD
jgi:glyoxylase-like metal-dependent hydrolase (beta-lactamase superfamily II)